MRINSNIALQGQIPNFLNTLIQSDAGAAKANEYQQQNAMRAMLREQGQGIINGDANALGELARFDPTTAQGIQSGLLNQQATRQNMDVQRQTQARLGRAEQRAIEQHAASMSAAEAAQAKQDIENDLAVLMTSVDGPSWDANAMATGNPDMVGQFDNREAVIAPFIGLGEAISRRDLQSAIPEPADEYGRYVQEQAALGATPLGRIEYSQAKKGNGVTITNPDGTITQIGGSAGAGSGKALTGEEGKATGFYARAIASAEIMRDFEAEGTSVRGRALNAVPFGAGNFGQTQEYQQFDQAKRDLVNAILRRESGAVISDAEFDNADKQYFPQPGDGPAVIEQKRKNLETTILGLQVSAGAGIDKLEQTATNSEPQGSSQIDFSVMDSQSVMDVDMSNYSDADFIAWQKRMDELGL